MQWMLDLKKQAPLFLEKIKGKRRSGFYHYSLSGDYFNESIKWGLGNSVFFLKIIYTLGLEHEYHKEVGEAVDYVKSFQTKNGDIFDPLVRALSIPTRIAQFLKNPRWDVLSGEDTIRAESRQAISALALYGSRPKIDYVKFPDSTDGVLNFVNSLDWKRPWSAGSHFSHLLFFIGHSNLEQKQELIDVLIEWLKTKQNHQTGGWYDGTPSSQQIINGAMKVITGLKAVNKVQFDFADKLVDFCLENENNKQACDNFNITYVLKYCNEILGSNYHYDRIVGFANKRLQIFREYYFPKLGGFSFYKGRSNRFYYGAPLSRGKNEPDIHGTVLFLWGVCLISQLLDIDGELKFKEFIT